MRKVFETNVFGVITVTNAMLPLLDAPPAPRIVNVSSGVGLAIAPTTIPSSTSTSRGPPRTPLQDRAQRADRAVRQGTAQPDILVNAADPGGCDTDLAGAGFPLPRTAAQGAAWPVRLATLGHDGPTGGFFDDDGPCRGEAACQGTEGRVVG